MVVVAASAMPMRAKRQTPTATNINSASPLFLLLLFHCWSLRRRSSPPPTEEGEEEEEEGREGHILGLPPNGKVKLSQKLFSPPIPPEPKPTED